MGRPCRTVLGDHVSQDALRVDLVIRNIRENSRLVFKFNSVRSYFPLNFSDLSISNTQMTEMPGGAGWMEWAWAGALFRGRHSSR